jgi:hypothetical protein
LKRFSEYRGAILLLCAALKVGGIALFTPTQMRYKCLLQQQQQQSPGSHVCLNSSGVQVALSTDFLQHLQQQQSLLRYMFLQQPPG